MEERSGKRRGDAHPRVRSDRRSALRERLVRHDPTRARGAPADPARAAADAAATRPHGRCRWSGA